MVVVFIPGRRNLPALVESREVRVQLVVPRAVTVELDQPHLVLGDRVKLVFLERSGPGWVVELSEARSAVGDPLIDPRNVRRHLVQLVGEERVEVADAVVPRSKDSLLVPAARDE